MEAALLLAVGQVLASAILDPLLERAIGAVANKFTGGRGVRKEIEKLASTLNVIRLVLADAEKRRIGESAVGEWLRQLKQVILDADDLLDEFATDAALQSRTADQVGASCFNCGQSRRIRSGRAMARQVGEINRRLDHLAQQRNLFGLQVLPVENRPLEHVRRPLTSSLLADKNSVIGRETESNKIIELLLASAHGAESMSNSRSFSVLPIVGMGGVGKTTIAKLVFNEENVKKHFDLRMWVCVSNDFDLTRITKEMIDAASFASRGKNEPYQITHWDLMQQKLGQEVEGRTFLLVLDDVWGVDRSQWEDLFEPLKFASRGSKILITTRIRGVVDKIQGLMDPFPLGALSDADLWPVFKSYAFLGVTNEHGTIDAQYLHLEAMGRNIVRRLKGSPLAARTIGSLLNTKLDAQHWKTILNNSEMWKLAQEADDILPVLGLSYQHLHGDLKQCFAYCSLFPKDYEFSKGKLVESWNAQCFIRSERGTTIEDTGNKYFDDLLYRSFFEPSSSVENHYVMHDLIHDMAEYVSMDDCFRLEDKNSDKIPDTVRHISSLVTEFDSAKLKELCSHEKLRTLLFLRTCEFDDLTHDLDVLFVKLKRLRVLGLYFCGVKELPDSIGGLKHLRYLDLSSNILLKKLPDSLGNLYNLQVLNLERCLSLSALPATMSKLINLRHLLADGELVSMIDGLGKLTDLQELEVTGRKVRELGGMSMLRKVAITYLEEVGTKEEAMQARLGSKELLQDLSLCWSRGRDADSVNCELEEEVLQALQPPNTITKLKIYDYLGARSPSWLEDLMAWASDDAPGHPLFLFPCLRELEFIMFPKLRQLFSLPLTLTRLHLDNVGLMSLPGLQQEYDTGEASSSYSSSPSSALSLLQIWNCPNLTSVSALLRHHLTALEKLEITGCEELASLPKRGLGHLVSLKTLEIIGSPKLTCEEEEEEDSPTLQALPPSLQQLHIVDCGDAMWRGLQHLNSLASLTLGGCPNTIASFFHHHHHHLAATLTKLKIENCRFDNPPPQAPLEYAIGGFRSLTSLTEFELYKSSNLLQNFGLGGLPSSLQSLFISGDDSFTDVCLFACLQDLTSLKAVSISDVVNLGLLPSMLSCLTFLETLKIEQCHQIQSLPEMAGLQESFLDQLSIQECENLCSLPATLSSLSSIRTLRIKWCRQIESLPETGLPASLEMLNIFECPLLAARCRDQECPDWPKISHIPVVIIDVKRII